MKRKKRAHGSKSEQIRKLTKTGSYTYYVTIPKAFIDELGWRERQNLHVSLKGSQLVVQDWKQGQPQGGIPDEAFSA